MEIWLYVFFMGWSPRVWFSRLFAPRDRAGLAFGASSFSEAGLAVGEDVALSIGAVFACVRLLATTVAAQPWHVFWRRSSDDRQRADWVPLYSVLHFKPNTYQSPFSFFEFLMVSLLLRGNAYCEIERMKSNKGYFDVRALHPIHPDRVQGGIEAGEHVYTIDGVKKTRADIFHVAGLSSDGYYGKSPLTLASDLFGLAKVAEKYGSRVFKNNATPSGVLLAGQTLTKDQAKTIADRWVENYGGNRAGGIAVLDGGAKFEKISISPEDAQFLGTRQFQVEEIARFFGVPPHKIAKIDKAAYASIEHQAIEFVQDSIRPWTVRIEQAINTQLIRQDGEGIFYAEANLDGLLRGDFSARTAGYATALTNGWMTVNEIRKKENMPGIGPEGDKFRIPLNIGIVGEKKEEQK